MTILRMAYVRNGERIYVDLVTTILCIFLRQGILLVVSPTRIAGSGLFLNVLKLLLFWRINEARVLIEKRSKLMLSLAAGNGQRERISFYRLLNSLVKS